MVGGWEHRLLHAGCSGAGDDTGEIVMVVVAERGVGFVYLSLSSL